MQVPHSKRRYALTVIALAVMVAGLFFTFHSAGRWHQGHPLSYWLDQLPVTQLWTSQNGALRFYTDPFHDLLEAEWARTRVNPVQHEAIFALDDLAPSHLGLLTARLGGADFRMVVALRRWAVKFHMLRRDRNAAGLDMTADIRRRQALTALVLLGDRAKPIVPELVRLAQNKNPDVRAAARHALERIAPEEYRPRKNPGLPSAN